MAEFDTKPDTLNQKTDGYRGIWYMNQPSHDEYVFKYSGGLATYTARSRYIARRSIKRSFAMGAQRPNHTNGIQKRSCATGTALSVIAMAFCCTWCLITITGPVRFPNPLYSWTREQLTRMIIRLYLLTMTVIFGSFLPPTDARVPHSSIAAPNHTASRLLTGCLPHIKRVESMFH